MKVIDQIKPKDFETISQQIHKLSALTNDNATSPVEAANYAAIIQKLLWKHNLTLDQLAPRADGRKKSADYKKEDFTLGVAANDLKQWKIDLFRAIAENNFCKVYNYTNSKYVVVIGEDDNIVAVKQMYAYLEYEIRSLGRNAYKVNSNRAYHSQMEARVWKGSFRDGAVGTVRQRLAAQRTDDIEETNIEHKKKIALETGVSEEVAMGNAGSALVIQKDKDVMEAVYEFYPSLRPTPPSEDEDGGTAQVKYSKRRGRPRGSGQYNGAAYWQGVEAGKSVRLQKEVSGSQTALSK